MNFETQKFLNFYPSNLITFPLPDDCKWHENLFFIYHEHCQDGINKAMTIFITDFGMIIKISETTNNPQTFIYTFYHGTRTFCLTANSVCCPEIYRQKTLEINNYIKFIKSSKEKLDLKCRFLFSLSPPLYIKENKVIGEDSKIAYLKQIIEMNVVISSLSISESNDPDKLLSELLREIKKEKNNRDFAIELATNVTEENNRLMKELEELKEKNHALEKNLREMDEAYIDKVNEIKNISKDKFVSDKNVGLLLSMVKDKIQKLARYESSIDNQILA
jgi:hypothetical protein